MTTLLRIYLMIVSQIVAVFNEEKKMNFILHRNLTFYKIYDNDLFYINFILLCIVNLFIIKELTLHEQLLPSTFCMV